MKLKDLRKAVDTRLLDEHLIIHLIAKESKVEPRILEDDPTPEGHKRAIEQFKKMAGSKSKAAFKTLLAKIAEKIEDREGAEFYTFPGGYGDTGNCSQCATWMQKILGGEIYGWEYGKNPEATIGEITDWYDHDFLLIDGHWLIDFWIFLGFPNGDAGTGIYDLKDKEDAAEVKRLYGPSENWEKSNPTILYDPWGSDTLK